MECRASRTPQKSQIPPDHFRFPLSFTFNISRSVVYLIVCRPPKCDLLTQWVRTRTSFQIINGRDKLPFPIHFYPPVKAGFCFLHGTPWYTMVHILIHNPHSELSCSGMSPLMHSTTTRSRALVVFGSAAAALRICPVGTGGIWTAGLGLDWVLISSPPFSSKMICVETFDASCLDYP